MVRKAKSTRNTIPLTLRFFYNSSLFQCENCSYLSFIGDRPTSFYDLLRRYVLASISTHDKCVISLLCLFHTVIRIVD